MTGPVKTFEQGTFLPGTGWVTDERDPDPDNPEPDEPDLDLNRAGLEAARAALRASRANERKP